MTKQELQQIIGNLNQLVNNVKGDYVNRYTILDAIRNDEFKRHILNILAGNNIPYTLCSISREIICLAHRIYELRDYAGSEKEYLNKTLRALDDFKAEIQRIQEYISLLKQIDAFSNSMTEYRERTLEGVSIYDYKCSLNNIEY